MSGLVWLGFVTACSLGTVARYLLDGYVRDRTAGRFPWGIWAINTSGSFVLGLLVGSGLGPVPLLIAGMGFCGAYTTFSTFAYETVVLAEEGRAGTPVLNVVGSVVGGLGAAALGIWLGGL